MRLIFILIFEIIIICNILIFSASSTRENDTSGAGGGVGGGGTSSGGGGGGGGGGGNEADNETDKLQLKFNNNIIRPNKPPPYSPYQIRHPGRRRPPKVCPGVHVRNDLKSFEQLRGCNIIDGPLTIALVSNQTHPYESKDYDNITFPELNEVTEYLLFFRVQGLSTLARLFPNLTVIRGRELVSNYALIIYEMMHLQKITLLRLNDILRGSVRIESNPNLCYVSTVNWEGICKHVYTPHFIKENNARCNNRCPDHCRPWNSKINSEPNRLQGDVKELGAENNRSLFCWNNQLCHEMCQSPDGMALPIGPNGGCCSSQCAGGCHVEERSDKCYACRSVSQEDKCVEHCDYGLYEYNGRCISEDECISMVEPPVQQYQCPRATHVQTLTSDFKAMRLAGEKHGRCQVPCPPGFEEDPTNKNKCKPCDKGKCKKVCNPPQGSEKQPFMITNVNSLRELSGCSIINGSLEISMKGGKNVLHELETAFQELEEIRGYLKITRSYPILTLGFLSRLKAINGSELDRGNYSLIIIDNPNLQELFMFNKSDSNQKQLKILEGKIFVHLNPKLCPHRIDHLKTYASVADWDERDVSLHTNGDKEACSTQLLEVEFLFGTARMAMIKFQNFAIKMDDPRSLLYYLINYREVPNGTVTMFDGRDGCNSQNDLWQIKEESPIHSKTFTNTSTDEYQESIIGVKPATRYALYVKTFTIHAGATGALSNIIYFETAPDTPGIPKHLTGIANDHESVTVGWSPPSKPDGIIERYIVTIFKTKLEDFQNLDTCDSIDIRDKMTRSITQTEQYHPEMLQVNSSNVSASSNEGSTPGAETCSRVASVTHVDIHTEVVTFQDLVIDIVYIRPQPCPTSNSTSKNLKRRSVIYDFNGLPPPPLLSDTSPKLGLRNLRDSSAIQTNEIGKQNVTTTTLPVNHTSTNQPTIKFDRSIEKTKVTINAASRQKPDQRLSYTISGLDHFTQYTIEVVACHGEFVGNRTQTSKYYKRCGIEAVTQVYTHPIPENDKVLAETILFNPINETSSENIITWERPERPNGVILAYRYRYRPKNGNPEVWTEGCVTIAAYNKSNGFILGSVNPGAYYLNVQTISTYSGQRFWSDPPYEFEILQNNLFSPLVIIIMGIFGVIVLSLAVFFGTYYVQQRNNKLTNGLIYASVNPDYIQYDPDEWEVDKANLLIGVQIGLGSFGMVYKGQLNTEKGTLSCAIKTVPPTSTAKQRMDFLREASIMKQFDTYHVVKLMGVVSTTTPVYVVMEYMENGDLKSFLRGQRELYQKEKNPLVEGIYLMAAQIADGMAYLASKKFVHRDLAARNCMVGENRVVKIGDFGLTRDIYANDYYRRDTQGRLPVRWMAPESLKDNLYTSASDVWSYGIVIWEMVTFSAFPYQGQSNDEVIKRVIHGYTMPRPDNCPDKPFTIMEKCWRKNDRDRPSFEDIVEYLLPDTGDKLYPNCFYRKHKQIEGDSIAQPIPEDNNSGAESYALLSWPSNRVNGLTNGVNHVQSDIDEKKVPIPP